MFMFGDYYIQRMEGGFGEIVFCIEFYPAIRKIFAPH